MSFYYFPARVITPSKQSLPAAFKTLTKEADINMVRRPLHLLCTLICFVKRDRSWFNSEYIRSAKSFNATLDSTDTVGQYSDAHFTEIRSCFDYVCLISPCYAPKNENDVKNNSIFVDPLRMFDISLLCFELYVRYRL